MKVVLLVVVFALGFACLGGCDSRSTKPADGNGAPPPQDSGEGKKGPRIPAPDKK